MEIEERLIRLHEHVQNHPKDYQAVIAELKLNSKRIEYQQYMKFIDRMKRVAEIRKSRKYAEQNE